MFLIAEATSNRAEDMSVPFRKVTETLPEPLEEEELMSVTPRKPASAPSMRDVASDSTDSADA